MLGEDYEMDLSSLLPLITDAPGYCGLCRALNGGEELVPATVPGAAKPYLIAALYRQEKRPLMVVTAQPAEARSLYEQMVTWHHNQGIRLFPEPDVLPYERMTPDVTAELERVRVLYSLARYKADKEPPFIPLVIASMPALMSLTTHYPDFLSVCHQIREGAEAEPLGLLRKWQGMGYEAESIVEVPGTMSRRGGILDIYPPNSELPARLEFMGNTVESIRLFDPQSQRSVRELSMLEIGPGTELLAPLQLEERELERILAGIDLSPCSDGVWEDIMREIELLKGRQRPPNRLFYAPYFRRGSLIDYLSEGTLLVFDEPSSVAQAMDELNAQAEQLRADSLKEGELPHDYPRPYFSGKEIEEQTGKRKRLLISSFGAGEAVDLGFTSAPGCAGKLASFLENIAELRRKKKRVIIASNQASRLSEILEESGIIAVPQAEIKEVPLPGSLTLVHGALAGGWVMERTTYLFTDAEIFGFVKERRTPKRRAVPRHKLFVDITPGDYVVHLEHGIGKLLEVTRMSAAGAEKEYLALQYAAGDKLYVPVDQIDRLSRYIGGGDRPPVLSRLGTQEWRRAKRRVKEAAEDLARELLELYASREVTSGFAFSRDTVWQQELEASFPYVETPDQMSAQQDVKEDMEKPVPMDRLVCGDVGYGKTEVALRAAFKAVMDNRQVAVLVPTTVLAEQHHATFCERLDAFPVRVEALSRFKSPREQQVILEDMSEGKVDIIIGTHRLLQKDVSFKDLGLLIIDEEQRFGVAHKEFLKRKRREVDVLTLSATPIPRTLHMSLVGVRDMSTMETPPEERLPIKTYVAASSERLEREAILRELERNGQVFFVHNRVQSIAAVAAKLQVLVPEARIAVAHGRMAPEDLETVMTGFARGENDVLVCTTIIESGLDLPNVNTLIVNQADKFGLGQLYQLRGRVGRGSSLAYAYFFYDGGKRLTPAAQKRLRTIYEATELGAGFNIAMKDLEIRGAGNLLGAKQSGHISAVGFSLYCRLLAEAVDEQKKKAAGEKEAVKLPPPTIDLPLSAFIPLSYVADVNTRLELYQNLARIESVKRLEDTAGEFSDRFGTVPAEVNNLLYAIKIKLLAEKAGVESISVADGEMVISLFAGMQFTEEQRRLLYRDGIKVGRRQMRLELKKPGRRWREALEEVLGEMGKGYESNQA